MEKLIEIKNLSVGFQSQGLKTNVVHSISFNIPKGKTVAIVGESGSGKTVTALSISKLLPRNWFRRFFGRLIIIVFAEKRSGNKT